MVGKKKKKSKNKKKKTRFSAQGGTHGERWGKKKGEYSKNVMV